MAFGRRSTFTPEARREETLARRQAPAQPVTVKPLHRGVVGGSVHAVQQPQRVKIEHKVRQSIRDSARGEDCTVRIPGACNHDPSTTVWSHYPLNDAGKGMGTKSFDLIGCYCCSGCHDVVDGRAPRPSDMTREQVLLAWFKGMVRSLVRLAQKGLV
jgi:hypothetical protein